MHEVRIRTSDGRRSIFIDDAFCKSLGLSVHPNEKICNLFLASWLTLLSDSPLEPEKKPYSLYKRFLSSISELGLKGIILKYSDLAHKLVSQHSLMGSGTFIGEWISDFKETPVFFEYNRYFQTGDPSLLNYIYTFLNFGKKLDYIDPVFNEVAFRDWLDIEKRLSDQSLLEYDILSLKTILRHILPTFSIEDYRPRFGPGSVQERGVKGRIEKLKTFQYDSYVDRFLFRGHIGKYGFGRDSGLKPSCVIPDVATWDPGRQVSSRIARLMFVPKNIKTARSICMEPNVLMFHQQGILREMIRLFSTSIVGRFIRIDDQSINRRLALHGSIFANIDTLDLSAASDSLSYNLIKKVFPPSWQIPMRATRSHSCYTPKGLHVLQKFAPMGSALCFPTQCIIFASVCIYAAAIYLYEVENVDAKFSDWLPISIDKVISTFNSEETHHGSGNFQPLAIYGDDICVDSRLTHIVKSILSSLGFTVNDSKSFCGNQAFRESCGGYYMAGCDITPLYFRVKSVRRKLTPNHVASHVHLINECWNRRYKNLYRFLRHSIMTWEPPKRFRNKHSRLNPIPYVSDPNKFGIMCTQPKNNHLSSRYHYDFQRDEIRIWTISYVSRIYDSNLLSVIDSYEYMRWWASRSGDVFLDVNSSSPRYDTGGTGFRWRWTPSE